MGATAPVLGAADHLHGFSLRNRRATAVAACARKSTLVAPERRDRSLFLKCTAVWRESSAWWELPARLVAGVLSPAPARERLAGSASPVRSPRGGAWSARAPGCGWGEEIGDTSGTLGNCGCRPGSPARREGAVPALDRADRPRSIATAAAPPTPVTARSCRDPVIRKRPTPDAAAASRPRRR